MEAAVGVVLLDYKAFSLARLIMAVREGPRK